MPHQEPSWVYTRLHFDVTKFTHAEEDKYGLYSRLLFKYFQSEGVMCGHTLFLAGASGRTEDIVKVRASLASGPGLRLGLGACCPERGVREREGEGEGQDRIRGGGGMNR